MPQQVTARLPDPVVDALDAAAKQLRRSRADIIRLSVVVDRLRDPSDPVLDWDEVRRALLHQG